MVFTIEDRGVAARVSQVQLKGVVLTDGLDTCAFVAYDKLLWCPGAEADLDDASMGLIHVGDEAGGEEGEEGYGAA